MKTKKKLSQEIRNEIEMFHLKVEASLEKAKQVVREIEEAQNELRKILFDKL